MIAKWLDNDQVLVGTFDSVVVSNGELSAYRQ